MVRFKKLAAVLLSAVMLVCCFTVQASAASVYDKAVKLSPMELASGNFKNTSEYFYKVVLNDSGKIMFYCSDHYNPDSLSWKWAKLTLIDSMGNEIIEKKALRDRLNKSFEITKKGTYYIKIEKGEGNDCYFNNFYYGFQPDHTPTISLALNAKVGDEFDFSALTSNYKGKVTMKTTDSKVADVDGNIVTCKKAGKAKIRAYMNNGDYAEITLIVNKK